MADPLNCDIIADRNVDHFETWEFLDVDWTGSTFKMQVRLVRDTTTTPLLEHTTGTGSFALGVVISTVAAHVAAGRLADSGEDNIYELINPATGVPYVGSDSLLLSQVSLGIVATNLEAFPIPEETGDDLEAFYDVIRTPATGSAELILRGKFIVRAGTTRP